MKKKIKNKIFLELKRIREVENRIAQKYSEQKMRCPVHLSTGQESIAVGVCQNLNKQDQIVTAHRSHAHYLAKGGNLNSMISELHGKKTGCVKGLGGSMHLLDLKSNVIAAVPIVGSTIPIGVGTAWANKLKKEKKIVVIFFGDGATEEGVFSECLDFASLHKLRVLFVCENNSFSVYSNLNKRQSKKRNIVKIANSHGLHAKKIKDHDILKVYETSKKIINLIKKKSQPYLLEINTFRDLEHCGPNNDDHLNYRSKKEIKFWKRNSQIDYYENKFLREGVFTKKNLARNIKNIKKTIDRAFLFAEKSDFEDPKKIKNYIFKQ